MILIMLSRSRPSEADWLVCSRRHTTPAHRRWSPRGAGTMTQGIYEGCTNSWHTLVTPEALSQINDTVTRGLITNWGYRLEKAHFLVDGGFWEHLAAPSRVIMGGEWTQRSRLRVSEHLMLSNFSPSVLSGIMGLQYQDVVWQTACCRAARESELQCWTVSSRFWLRLAGSLRTSCRTYVTTHKWVIKADLCAWRNVTVSLQQMLHHGGLCSLQ